jgi:3-hydroxyisobutyrate dehydrogenase-like beta-hydroxyacid dehydrogenase
VGPVGAGHTIKALNMLALAANMLATLEVIAIGRRRGLSEQAVNASLIADGAGSYACDVHLPRFIFPRSYDSGFSFDLMRKDLAIGREVARRAGASAAFGDEVIAFYDAQRELTGADNTRIAEVYLGGEGAEPADAAPSDFAASLTALMRLTLLCIAAEIVAIGRAAGLDPRDVVRVLSAGSGRSDALSSLAPSDSAEAPVIDGDRVRALRDRGAGAADTHAPLPSRFTSLAMSAADGVEGGERLTCQELASKVMAARKEHPPASC